MSKMSYFVHLRYCVVEARRGLRIEEDVISQYTHTQPASRSDTASRTNILHLRTLGKTDKRPSILHAVQNALVFAMSTSALHDKFTISTPSQNTKIYKSMSIALIAQTQQNTVAIIVLYNVNHGHITHGAMSSSCITSLRQARERAASRDHTPRPILLALKIVLAQTWVRNVVCAHSSHPRLLALVTAMLKNFRAER